MSIKKCISSLTILDIEALVELAKHKTPMYVYNGAAIESIKEVLNGKKGTRVITE